MKLIRQSVEFIGLNDPIQELKKLERIGRVCYKSENRITEDTYKEFLLRIVKNGHESVLEHINFTVKFITDRGVTHELVRHRLCSYSQESTRYCKYDKDVTFIIPVEFYSTLGTETFIVKRDYIEFYKNQSETLYNWLKILFDISQSYSLLMQWCTAQFARSILPNCLKTEIYMTTNLRQLKHIYKLRSSKFAHPQMADLMTQMFNLIPKNYMFLLG